MAVITRSQALKLKARSEGAVSNSKTFPQQAKKKIQGKKTQGKKTQGKKTQGKTVGKVPSFTAPAHSTPKDAETLASKILSQFNEATSIHGTSINGGPISKNNVLLRYNYHPGLVQYLREYFQRHEGNDKMKLWLSFKYEELRPNMDHVHHSKCIPVLIVIESEVEPIDYIAECSSDSIYRSYSSFEYGMHWVKKDTSDSHYILKWNDALYWWGEAAVLPLTKPSIVNDAPCPDSSQFGPSLGQIRTQCRIICNRSERKLFKTMVTKLARKSAVDESVIEASLEAMQAFKIQPELGVQGLPRVSEVVPAMF